MKVNSKFVDMMNLEDLHCKDYSHHCMSISARGCRMPIQADVCKRSCGLCNGEQLHGFPTYPLHLPGKQLNTSLPGCNFWFTVLTFQNELFHLKHAF